MIKFIASGEGGKTIIGLGLVEGNIKRLKEDMPIIVWLQELGIKENIEICLFYGKTEQEIYDRFKKEGLLKNTKINSESPEI